MGNSALVSSYAELWAQSLPPGQSERAVCPACRAPEKSFVVSRLPDGSLAWICHRAHCGIRGRAHFSGPRPLPAKARPHAIPPATRLDLSARDRWGYSKDILSGGYYYPIVGFLGQLGFQLRWYDGRKPKVRTYITQELECETMHWQLARDSASPHLAVIVEDIPSSLCVAKVGYTAIALLGTLFSPGRAAELHRAGYTDILFLLDRDAYSKGVRYAQEWAPFFHTAAACPDKDPKDSTPESLVQLIEAYCGKQDIIGTVSASPL